MNIAIGIGYCYGLNIKLVLVLDIVKASLEILGIGIEVKKVVLLMSGWLDGSILLIFMSSNKTEL